jgi:cob(I)alamin adenosyltransferase
VDGIGYDWPRMSDTDSFRSRLYTRSGDDGTTGLFGGGRVPKDHPRVEAYGCVDELNAAIGLAAAEVGRLRETARGNGRAFFDLLLHVFADLQSRLFDIGADLATPEGAKHEAKIMRIGDEHVAEVEGWIDEIDSGNLPMKSFVMPGGTELAARLHLARTICRRAERAMIHLRHAEPVSAGGVSEGAIVYINRVSDLLFAMARRANKEAGVADVPWTPGRGK